MPIKQVIVMRKDLKMRRGKEIAQGSHASMVWLCKRIQSPISLDMNYNLEDGSYDERNLSLIDDNQLFTEEQKKWLYGSFAKVCLQVNSEEELNELYIKAREAGLEVHMIIDSGKTEFNGVPTRTCFAIGPHEAEKIDAITGHLKLY